MITTSYWSKAEHVTAVRLNEHNIREVATAIGGELWEESNGWAVRSKKPMPYIKMAPRSLAGIGDWVVMRGKNTIRFYSDEKFLAKYHTISEVMADSARLEAVYRVIMDAMHSSRVDNEGFDTIAASAALQIMDI